MANFAEHIAQSKQNLLFLSDINKTNHAKWDWQVTVCFYSAVHLINAHIVSKNNANYLSHIKVESALNPFTLSPARLDENTYKAYNKLSALSRRSRYLLREDYNPADALQLASSTHSVHFRKAITQLNVIIDFINANYGGIIGKTDISCIDLNNLTYSNFTVINV